MSKAKVLFHLQLSNIPPKVSKEDLYDYFKGYGDIIGFCHDTPVPRSAVLTVPSYLDLENIMRANLYMNGYLINLVPFYFSDRL